MRRSRGTTRRDPPKAVKDSPIPTAAAIPGSAITSGTVAPAYLGTGAPDATKFLRGDGTWQLVTGGGGVGARGDVVKTTALLGDGIEETDVIALGKSFIPLRLTVDRACRVRLYATAAQRTADSARPPGVDPVGEHGCILDIRLNAGTGLIWDINDPTTGRNLETVVTTDIPYRVKNESGATGTITMTFSRILLET